MHACKLISWLVLLLSWSCLIGILYWSFLIALYIVSTYWVHIPYTVSEVSWLYYRKTTERNGFFSNITSQKFKFHQTWRMAQVDKIFWIPQTSVKPIQKDRNESSEHIRLRYGMLGRRHKNFFCFPEDDGKKYSVIKEKFENYFVKCYSKIYERARFNQRNQLSGEPPNDFIISLYCLVEHCG